MTRLLVLYAKNNAELFNRKSALGSYIFNLAGLLSSANTEVYLNGIPFRDLAARPADSAKSTPPKSPMAGVKKLVPLFFRRVAGDRKVLNEIERLAQNIAAQNRQYDHVLEFYSFGSDLGFAIARQQGIPLSLVYDAPLLEEYRFFNNIESPYKKRILQLEKKSIEQASYIVVYSKPMEAYLRKRYPQARAIFGIHQNIDFSRFRVIENTGRPNDPLNLCFIGSFLKWHRVDILLKAFHRLTSTHPNLAVHLYLVGDGMERNSSEALALELGLKNFEFTGFLDGTQLEALQQKMHVGIMPGSNWYGAPNKLFEYGAMNMAAIAPATPTILDLFNENEVLFFENNNLDSFYTALEKICLDDQLRAKISQSLHEKIKREFGESKTRMFYLNKVIAGNLST